MPLGLVLVLVGFGCIAAGVFAALNTSDSRTELVRPLPHYEPSSSSWLNPFPTEPRGGGVFAGLILRDASPPYRRPFHTTI